MKSVLMFIKVCFIILFLVGCDVGNKKQVTKYAVDYNIKEIHLKDGTRCVIFKEKVFRGGSGGISCDFKK